MTPTLLQLRPQKKSQDKKRINPEPTVPDSRTQDRGTVTNPRNRSIQPWDTAQREFSSVAANHGLRAELVQMEDVLGVSCRVSHTVLLPLVQIAFPCFFVSYLSPPRCAFYHITQHVLRFKQFICRLIIPAVLDVFCGVFAVL